jgi:hypothetical protein
LLAHDVIGAISGFGNIKRSKGIFHATALRVTQASPVRPGAPGIPAVTQDRSSCRDGEIVQNNSNLASEQIEQHGHAFTGS